MPLDYYIGQSIEDLEKLLRSAQARKAKGNITEVTAAGVRTVRDFGKNVGVEREIFDLRYSLFLRAQASGKAELQEKWPDPRRERITRTQPYYTDLA